MGKIYYAVIRVEPSGKRDFLEKISTGEGRTRVLRQFPLCHALNRLHQLYPQTVKPRVSLVRRFVQLLWAEWHPYTSARLKRGVGAFVGDYAEAQFCS